MGRLHLRLKVFVKKFFKGLLIFYLVSWGIGCVIAIFALLLNPEITFSSLSIGGSVLVSIPIAIVMVSPYLIYFFARNIYRKQARMRQDYEAGRLVIGNLPPRTLNTTPTTAPRRRTPTVRAETIPDEQVPSLIQNGLANAMRAEAQSTNPALHRTYKEEELEFQFTETYGSIMSTYENAFEEAYQKSDLAVDDAVVMVELRNTITLFNKARNWAYSKGKGGKIYFQDMWEYQHNSKNDCFSYIDSVVSELSELETVGVVRAPNIMNIINQPLVINFKLDRYFSKNTPTDIKRILLDSLNNVKTTRNLSTFISRFNLMLDKSERLGKNSAKFTNDLISLYPALLSNCVDRALFNISKLKTEKARKNKISKIVDILKESMIYVQACGLAETEQVNRLTTLLN